MGHNNVYLRVSKSDKGNWEYKTQSNESLAKEL